MTLIFAGLLLWTLVHWTPALFPGIKTRWKNTLGPGAYQGSFALLIISALVLIVLGWRSTPPEHVYQPMLSWRHPAMGLVVVGFILMGAANYASRLKAWLRHPQLTGFMLWATAHLLLNGDHKSVLVFSWMLLWAGSEILLINRRDGRWQAPEVVSWPKEILGVLVSLGVVALVVWLHPYLSGRHVVL
ncbi:NnrU family protein [Marinicella sediminis]|uniref:NnrU family protein n=1 Tax=Marinicella sediminis TaxID=1792834 RepID=A0ABV7JBW8_9GAMM|nr:NnrU family protein [Marinicella sediminis]